MSLLVAVIVLFLLAGNARAEDDKPTLAKDSLQITAFTFNVYHKNFDVWSWVPKMEFHVNGPIASGSQLYVDFNIPGTGPFVKFDCKTGQTQKGYWWKTECGARDIPEEKGTLYTGPVNFAIHMRNELAGADTTLFSGKMKVAKAHSNEVGPKAVNKFVYYIDHDWNLPIGYVYLTQDDVRGWKYPRLNIEFWVRGDASNLQPHVFHSGAEVGNIMWKDEEVGRASCSGELENTTTHYVDASLPQKAKWTRVHCSFPNIRGWDKTGDPPGMFGPLYILSANPGDYEFKLLWHNHLARSIKFTVTPEGKFDNGIAAANALGSDKTIVPVQILGDQDGKWGRDAWKTDAFYGNPLKGFTAVP